LYRYLFGRAADSLEQSTENPDEYMIGDDDMLVTRSVVVPHDMKELSCGAIVAGIVEGVMDGAGFVSNAFMISGDGGWASEAGGQQRGGLLGEC